MFLWCLLFETIGDECAKPCFTFHNVHSVLYFPGNNAPYTVITINQLKYWLHSCTMGKYCMWVWSQGKYSTRLHLVLYYFLTTPLCNISCSALAASL